MWKQGNEISMAELQDIDTIFFRFNCGLCGAPNILEFYEFYSDFFLRRPEYKWKDNLECSTCEGANYHDIQLYYQNGFLHLEVENERTDYMQTEVNPSSIFYNIDRDDIHENTIEIPLEFDFIESIIGNDFYGNYKKSISEIIALIEKSVIAQESTLLKILYSNVISIFETFLSDLIINAVNSHREVLERIVADYQIFGKEKIEKSNIFKEYFSIKENVNDELKKIIFHNLKVVIPLFKQTLEIDFSSKINGLHEAIIIRHDIVHRNGKDFNNMYHMITVDQLSELKKMTSEIVDFVNEEYNLKKKSYLF